MWPVWVLTKSGNADGLFQGSPPGWGMPGGPWKNLAPGSPLYCAVCVRRGFRLFTISPLTEMCTKKTYLTLDNFIISPLNHNNFTISPYVQKILIHHYTIYKTKKNCTISSQNHIDTFQSPHHINTSPYHDFTISPRCYKCESTRYNKKRSDKIKMSKYNSNVPIYPYKHSSRDEKTTKQTIHLQKRRHQIFSIIPITK